MASDRAARDRILDTATRLFYAHGVRAVGVDRIIAYADVATATFYRHFPSKNDLVATYVDAQSDIQRAATIATIDAATDPVDGITEYFMYLCDVGATLVYRGCPIVNVAVEFPDPAHPVREAVERHRDWYRRYFESILQRSGHAEVRETAASLVLLRDGVLIGLDLDDPGAVRRAVMAALPAVLRAGRAVGRRRRVAPRHR